MVEALYVESSATTATYFRDNFWVDTRSYLLIPKAGAFRRRDELEDCSETESLDPKALSFMDRLKRQSENVKGSIVRLNRKLGGANRIRHKQRMYAGGHLIPHK